MTDSTTPEGANPGTGTDKQAGKTAEQDDRTKDPTKDGAALPNSTTDAAPLSDSTDGGLDGGDPGVEE